MAGMRGRDHKKRRSVRIGKFSTDLANVSGLHAI